MGGMVRVSENLKRYLSYASELFVCRNQFEQI